MTGSPSIDISVAIANAKLPTLTGLHQIQINQSGAIARIIPMDVIERSLLSDDTEVIDVQGDWISLGGVDLQINGALGLAFPDLSRADLPELEKICRYLWTQGVDGFLPTLVTTAMDKVHQALEAIAHYQAATHSEQSAEILGVHLEGPCLNSEKRGAHPAEHLQPLTVERVQQILGEYGSMVKVMTLAPELDSTGEVIPYLRSQGIVVSLGHSQATAAQAQAAFTQGASMVTHAFNAMPGLHHREPGLLGAALVQPNVATGFIADGEHVSPLMLDLLVRICRGRRSPSAYPKGLFLVSDALAPLGLPDGLYPWDSRQIQVIKGTARLFDGTLSGTTLPLLVGVQNLVQWGICSPGEAIALATEAPRRAIGLPGLGVGQSASLLRWSSDPTTAQLSWQRLDLSIQ